MDGRMTVQILTGDCMAVLPTLAADSVHAVVTDPPAGIAPWPTEEAGMTDAERLQQIESRVRRTICDTYGRAGHTVEGRISQDDFNALLTMIGSARASERERCALLHESINPASDGERLNGHPGAGAIGAVIEYRDAIRGTTSGFRTSDKTMN